MPSSITAGFKGELIISFSCSGVNCTGTLTPYTTLVNLGACFFCDSLGSVWVLFVNAIAPARPRSDPVVVLKNRDLLDEFANLPNELLNRLNCVNGLD